MHRMGGGEAVGSQAISALQLCGGGPQWGHNQSNLFNIFCRINCAPPKYHTAQRRQPQKIAPNHLKMPANRTVAGRRARSRGVFSSAGRRVSGVFSSEVRWNKPHQTNDSEQTKQKGTGIHGTYSDHCFLRHAGVCCAHISHSLQHVAATRSTFRSYFKRIETCSSASLQFATAVRTTSMSSSAGGNAHCSAWASLVTAAKTTHLSSRMM